ncbi:hypothetical protein ABIE51_001444 [Lysobacter sp. OAE881]
MINFLRGLLPPYWIMIDPYSKGLDRFVNNSLDQGCLPQRLNPYEATLNGREFWVGNWPYSYATTQGVRPSRATIIRFRAALDSADFPLTSAAPSEPVS